MENHIIEGVPVCGGVITGNVKVINSFAEISNINEGDIIVIPDNNPLYALGVMKASGLICEVGGIISHICTVALEAGIPSITQAKEAIAKLKKSNKIKLDANEGKVYVVD